MKVIPYLILLSTFSFTHSHGQLNRKAEWIDADNDAEEHATQNQALVVLYYRDADSVSQALETKIQEAAGEFEATSIVLVRADCSDPESHHSRYLASLGIQGAPAIRVRTSEGWTSIDCNGEWTKYFRKHPLNEMDIWIASISQRTLKLTSNHLP